MLDFRSMESVDVSKHGTMFGVGLDVHHAERQKWSYVRHQGVDEVIFLKCFDSAQGEDGSAKYSAHVAGVLDDSEGVEADKIVPRESVEVRLVALWE